MHVAFVNSTHIWSGVKSWCLNNAAILESLGHRATIYGRPGEFIEKARRLGLNAIPYRFGFDFNPLSIRYFMREFRMNHVDICICNISKDMRSAGIAAKLLGIPLVHRLGDPGDLVDRPKTRLTQRWLQPSLIACSEFCKAGLLNRVPILREYPFTVIHPGVDCSLYQDERAVYTPRTIVTTCRLDPEKGHKNLFNGLGQLAREGYDFRLRVIGRGTIAEELQVYSAACGIADKTVFTGFTTKLHEELAEADIYVLPSDCEAYGVALAEAFAAGLPCVAKRVGGPPEIWPASHDNLLISPDDTGPAFAESLRFLLNLTDSELAAVGRDFRSQARKECDRQTQGERLADWLQSVIADYHRG